MHSSSPRRDDARQALSADTQPGDLSLTLADALGQADEAMRRARDALNAAHRVEQQMRIADDRHQAMAAASSSINWLVNGDGLMEEGVYWRSFTGQSAREARGWGWLDATHPEDHARVVAGWREALRQQLPYTDEFRIRRVDGVYLDFLTQAAPIYEDDGSVREWVGVSIDITQRKRLERVAREAERLAAARASELEAALEAMTDGVTIFDAAGNLLRMNQAASRYLASTAAVDAIQQPYIALVGEVLVGADEGARHAELRVVGMDGHERELSVTGVAIRDEERRVTGAVVVARDVTERNRLERQRKDMLQTVGHDLGSPLQAARIYVERSRRRLDKQPAPDERDAQALDALDHALARIERLVGDLQLAASIELGMLRLMRTPADLTSLAQAEADLTATATGRTIALAAPTEQVMAAVDAGRIGQTLANLLGNAHKYSPRERPIHLTLHVEQRMARVAVRDEGPGIPPEEQERIWEQFHQVKSIKPMAGMAGGLGLGLYIARHIVEAHGGQIGVESAPGHGATFWFTVPLASG